MKGVAKMKVFRKLGAAGLACLLFAGLLGSAAAAGTDISCSVASGGMAHTLALKSDGSVWAWGSNESGQLGRSGDVTESKLPVKIEGLTAVSITAGYNFSAALENDGNVIVWGGGSAKPTPVADLDNVTAISAGQTDMLALKYDGSVWQWTVGSGSRPKLVTGLQKIAAISAGGGQFLALSITGQVWCWGRNDQGQLGLGDTTDRSEPVHMSRLADIVDIAAGYTHSLAVSFDGKVYAWGSNTYGQLGDSTLKSSSIPVAVRSLGKIRQVSAGADTSMALADNGSIYTWGYGEYGQLGSGNSEMTRTTPTTISSGTVGTTVFITSGLYHNMMVTSSGSMYTWGRNKNGQLGNGRNTNSEALQYTVNLAIVGGAYKTGNYSINNLQGLHSWSETEIKALSEKTIVPPGLWSDYDKNITRAELAYLLVSVYEKVTGFSISGGLTTKFQDIENHPLKEDILRANYLGFINGRSTTIFAPDDNISREEAAKMLGLFVARIKNITIQTTNYVHSIVYYSDADAVSKWAIPYVAFAHDNTIMLGSNGVYDPKGLFTREQSLLTVARLAASYSWKA